MEEVEQAASLITKSAHPDANIIWGIAFDEQLNDEMSITVVATGFESVPEQTAVGEAQAAGATGYVKTPTPVFTGDGTAAAASPAPAQPEKDDDSHYFDSILDIINNRH